MSGPAPRMAKESRIRVGKQREWLSRLRLPSGGAKFDGLPFDRAKQLIPMPRFDAVWNQATAYLAIIAETQLAAVVSRIRDHLHRGESAVSGIEDEMQLSHVPRSDDYVRLAIDAWIRRGTVVIDLAEFLCAFDQHLSPQMKRRQKSAAARRAELLVEVLGNIDLCWS